MGPNRGLLALAFCLGLSCLSPPPAAGSGAPQLDPTGLIAELEEVELAYGLAQRVEKKELRLGFTAIRLEEGLLIPLATPSGWQLELLFLGRGRLLAEPPDDIEAGQLELFTGKRRLDTSFTAAFLAAPAARLAELQRSGRSDSLEPAEKEQADAIFEGRAELAELAVLDVGMQLLLAALGEPLAAEFFAGIFETADHGVLCLGHDLEAEDPLGIGQWVPFEADPEAEEKGAAGAGDEGDEAEATDAAEGDDADGVYDVWVEGHDASRPPPAANTTFEPRHYQLDIELDPAAGRLRGNAKIELAAQLPSRVVKLNLHGDLEVQKVRSSTGEDLYFHRSGEVLRVFLPERREPGQSTSLELDYAGQFFESGKKRKSRGLRDNIAFYPHAGEIDEATYDFVLRWPRGWEVVAAGELVDEGRSAKGWWQKRRLLSPTWGPTFAIGQFKKRSRQVGPVRIHMALGSDLGGAEADLEEMLDAAASSLKYFSEVFGPYPLKELTLASAPAEISQSLLGFIALSDEMMEGSGAEAAELGLEDRRTVIAHEVAHQWWGHQIGWLRWRDQWISEAMANYAAALWARRFLPDLDPAIGPNGAWQEDLTVTLPDGRSLEAVGPLVLGGRLDSSLTEDAFEPIVYRKGALVLDTFCQLVGESACLRAYGRLARENQGRKLSTQQFLSELARLSGRNLESFAKQWIYGTGLPEVYYRHRSEKIAEGKWRLEVEAEAESSYHFRYRLEKGAEGRLAIVWSRVDEIDLDQLELAAPLRIYPGQDEETPRQETFTLRGRRTQTVYELNEEPQRVELDPEQRVFARFWSEGSDPKRFLYYRGYDRLTAGDLEAARKMLSEALQAKTPGAEDDDSVANFDRAFDTSIHLAKARLALREGQIPEAAAAIAAAKKALPEGYEEVYQGDLAYFEALLAWHQGDAEKSFRQLKALLLDKAESDDTEAWLYLALAARAAGHQEELDIALAQAAARGIDVALLQEAP